MFETERTLKFAKLLISLGCVQVNPEKPYTYASGLKGPIYTDNRAISSFVIERLAVTEGLVEVIRESGLKFDFIAGLATAGIAHGMMAAHILGTPFGYVRSSAKGHGKTKQVEGIFKKGDKAILVEDLVNQGSSLDKAIVAAKEAGLDPVACVCIVDYQMQAAQEVANKHGIKLLSLTNFKSLSHVAALEGGFSKDSQVLLEKWHKDPSSWP